ncbi:NAD(P)/FAD-dependent oxidoreductase [Leeia oryzae]|uniref:NAD(P)/FAD-dependent oxidoreductase n=1 Tax=Leeia oryzae TaxID=356662 RepID=UPI000367C0FD|nr:FAD-binding oxidoreductase [Leeia oryzae]
MTHTDTGLAIAPMVPNTIPSAPALLLTHQPLPETADVVIVGSGIMGCATAYYLAKHGIKAVVIDKSRIAGQQSTRAWGFVRQQARAPEEVPLMMASNRLWQGLEADLQADLEWRQGGCLFTASHAEEMATYEDWMSIAKTHQLDTRLLTPQEIRQQLPDLTDRPLGALYTASDGQAEPRKVAPAFARRATELGARFFEGCGLTGLELADGKVVGVQTEMGSIRTRQVVCAAGVASWRILKSVGIDLPQHLVRGTVARTSPGPQLSAVSYLGNGIGWRQRTNGSFNLADDAQVDVDITLGHLRGLEWYLGPLMTHHKSFRFNVNRMTLDDLRQRLPGSEARHNGPLVHVRDLALLANEGKARGALRALHQSFPSQKQVQIVDKWAGGIDVLPDGIPVIDALTQPDGLLVATGFCGHGFAMGPIVGKVMADWISKGEPGFDLHGLRLARFPEKDVKPPYSLF